jgi:hypothetical protein
MRCDTPSIVTKVLASALILGVCVVGYFAYHAYTRHRDIVETLAWMDQTYNPHEGGDNFDHGHGTAEHYLVHTREGTEDLTEKFQTTFSRMDGCKIVIHQETFPVGVFKNVYSTTEQTVNLCDVDPTSIKLIRRDLHNDVFDCADPEAVELFKLNCDSAEIVFRTRNDVLSIKEKAVRTFAELKGPEHEQHTESKTNVGWFNVDDATYAQRFVAAFRHAVETCGGAASKF